MSYMMLSNAKFVLDGIDLSTHVKQIGITYSAAALDNTAMGSTTKTSQGGLFNWPVSLDLYQDYGSGSVDATLFPLVGTVVTIQINPVDAANSATNPAYEGSVLVESYEPVSGSVGQLAMTKLSLQPASALTRATS